MPDAFESLCLSQGGGWHTAARTAPVAVVYAHDTAARAPPAPRAAAACGAAVGFKRARSEHCGGLEMDWYNAETTRTGRSSEHLRFDSARGAHAAGGAQAHQGARSAQVAQATAATSGRHPHIVAKLLRTRELTHETRSARTALGITGVDRDMAALSVEEEGEVVLELARALDKTAARRSALTQYTKYCLSKGHAPIFPITLKVALGYASFYVIHKKNGSHVAPGAMSNFRVAAKAHDEWAVTPEEDNVIRQCIKALKKTLPSAPKENVGADLDLVIILMSELATRPGAASSQLGCTISFMINFKMRGTEVFSPRGIRKDDVELEDRGAIFKARLCKIEQTTLSTRPRAAPHLPPELGVLCATWWMRRYLKEVDPDNTMPANNHLFCELSAAGRWTDRPPEPKRAHARVMAAFAGAGINTAELNDEWGRHTGHDLHVYKCGMMAPTSDLLGDHAADTTSKRHYLHPDARASTRRDILNIGYKAILGWAGATCCRDVPVKGTVSLSY